MAQQQPIERYQTRHIQCPEEKAAVGIKACGYYKRHGSRYDEVYLVTQLALLPGYHHAVDYVLKRHIKAVNIVAQVFCLKRIIHRLRN